MGSFPTTVMSFLACYKERVLLGILGYLLLIRLLRYMNINSLRRMYSFPVRHKLKSMTLLEAWDIQRRIFAQEFPFMAEKALQFALLKTYGIPTETKLLVMTKQLSSKTFAPKRYMDTVVLVSEFMTNEPHSSRTLGAIARINFIHGKYQARGQISNDDMIYTLALFAIEPLRWINKYEWRTLTQLEVCALGVFWKAQGDAMNIDFSPLDQYVTKNAHQARDDGLAWMEAVERWSVAYEEKAMVPDKNNKIIAEHTLEILLWNVPKPLHSVGRKAVSALMNQRLRDALMFPSPPTGLQIMLEGILHLRKYIIRYLFPPRPWYFRFQRISDEPNKDGRFDLGEYDAEPWYVRVSWWNQNGIGAWLRWLAGLPIPSNKFQSQGYRIHEIGPASVSGKGNKEQEVDMSRLREIRRGGCPFA